MMKKLFLIAIAAVGLMTANAQTKTFAATNFWSNWSIGLDGGATSPMHSNQPVTNNGFWENMRPVVGLHLEKQISPMFALGFEGSWGINTSYTRSKNVFDTQYVGVYGATNLMNLFGGVSCSPRVFEIEAVAGAGWGHSYMPSAEGEDWNWFATKAGLNFNFNLSKVFTLSFKPSVTWDMTDGVTAKQTSCAYDGRKANVNLMLGATFHLGKGFNCVNAYTQADIDALNATINGLQADLAACVGDLAACTAQLSACGSENARLKAELDACRNRKPETKVVEKSNLESVRYIYFALASSQISAEQMRTVDIIASFMNNHPDAKLDVKGYASPEGSLEFNNKLAADRAESVKNTLVDKFNINADRINAQGEGIGNMFSEPSWNRVAICTLDK